VLAFYIVPLSDMVIFAVLIWYAFRDRRDSASHKRLIYIATVSLLIAAVARFHWSFVHRRVVVAGLASDIFLVFLWAYDLWTLRKLHRSTLWGSVFFLFLQQVRFPIGQSEAWHRFSSWVMVHAR
jgi:FtsH-binding integral membrane protein